MTMLAAELFGICKIGDADAKEIQNASIHTIESGIDDRYIVSVNQIYSRYDDLSDLFTKVHKKVDEIDIRAIFEDYNISDDTSIIGYDMSDDGHLDIALETEDGTVYSETLEYPEDYSRIYDVDLYVAKREILDVFVGEYLDLFVHHIDCFDDIPEGLYFEATDEDIDSIKMIRSCNDIDPYNLVEGKWLDEHEGSRLFLLFEYIGEDE